MSEFARLGPAFLGLVGIWYRAYRASHPGGRSVTMGNSGSSHKISAQDKSVMAVSWLCTRADVAGRSWT